MSLLTRKFPDGTLVIRTDLTVSSIASTHPGKKIACDAIWDTGANASAISLAVARKLGLMPVSTAFFATANGRCEMPMYMVDLTLPNGHCLKNIMVSGLNLGVCDALVGMDIITLGDFHLTNGNGMVFKFAIPPESNKDISHKP